MPRERIYKLRATYRDYEQHHNSFMGIGHIRVYACNLKHAIVKANKYIKQYNQRHIYEGYDYIPLKHRKR